MAQITAFYHSIVNPRQADAVVIKGHAKSIFLETRMRFSRHEFLRHRMVNLPIAHAG